MDFILIIHLDFKLESVVGKLDMWKAQLPQTLIGCGMRKVMGDQSLTNRSNSSVASLYLPFFSRSEA